ncbi:MAG: uroporphyrinogen-III synthase [Acidimicrobiales bacterium]|nr:uroporphyrinogen-III synthase [Acidimicrobiales bacterium]
MDAPLQGRTIAITADRRSAEQGALFAARGADVIHGATMQTLDLRQDRDLRSVTVELIARPPDWLIATTGMGMRHWFEAADAWGLADDLRRSLGAARIVARGAKATSALRKLGLEPAWKATSEQMREVHDHLRSHDLGSARVAVQLFDVQDRPELVPLAALAAETIGVPVYRWQLPDDLGPALGLVDAVLESGARGQRVDAITFTSQPAVRYLFRIANEHRGSDAPIALRDALLGAVLPVCIGPVCAEALVEHGVTTAVWPEPNRLVPMVKLVVDQLG